MREGKYGAHDRTTGERYDEARMHERVAAAHHNHDERCAYRRICEPVVTGMYVLRANERTDVGKTGGAEETNRGEWRARVQ